MSPVGREWRREPLYHLDPELNELLRSELIRQQETLELIASENFASRAVLEATGSVLTNKYAEGLPGARYYGGCEIVDRVEQLAIDRCKAVFGAEHVNVQPHSGSSANLAALFALLDPGDTLMGMEMTHGGHLTHGLAINYSGRTYDVVQYHVRRDTETIDYDEVRELALARRPKLIICGYSSYPRTVDWAAFRAIALPRLVGPALLTLLFYLWSAYSRHPRRLRDDRRHLAEVGVLAALGLAVVAWNLLLRR